MCLVANQLMQPCLLAVPTGGGLAGANKNDARLALKKTAQSTGYAASHAHHQLLAAGLELPYEPENNLHLQRPYWFQPGLLANYEVRENGVE
jgi:hypothetical protein